MNKIKSFGKYIQRTEKHHKKLFLFLLVLTSILFFLPVFIQLRYQEFRGLGLVGVFLLNLFGSATIFLPAPAFISVGIQATQSHPLLVALIAALGSAIGESATFLFGFSTSQFFDFKKHKTIYMITNLLLHKWKGVFIIIFSFIPNPIFDGLGMLAGITSYPIKRFLMLTFTGRLLRNILIAYSVLHFV